MNSREEKLIHLRQMATIAEVMNRKAVDHFVEIAIEADP
jgi:hypothetical protein